MIAAEKSGDFLISSSMQNANEDTTKIIGEAHEPTLDHNAPTENNEQTKYQYSPETAPTQAATTQRHEEEISDGAEQPSDENGLPPHRLRFALICLLFALLAADFAALTYQYTSRDKQLLETRANQIALVHENLSLKDRVRREQQIKTEVLSRFDEGNINLLKECPRCGRCYDRNNKKCEADNTELIFSLPVERTIEDRYRLEKLIGKGGMGAVYEATDLRINRAVALKILSGASFGNREALRRFER